MKEITKNLILLSIEPNNWKHDNEDREVTTCFALFFSFQNKDGFIVYITDTALKSENPSFAMIESDEGDLHESFSAQLDEHWSTLVAACNEFEKAHFAAECRLVGSFV